MKKKTKPNLVSSDGLFGQPPILAGEDAAAYDVGRVYAAIKLVDVIDEMLIADVVASECEFLRWSRLKLSMIQACAANKLEKFLEGELNRITNYDLYRERFAEDLTEMLRNNLPEDYPEDRLHWLARDCSLNKTEAVDEVNKLLTNINLHMDVVHRAARINRAKEEHSQRTPGGRALCSRP
jgi:hypothetical protein